MSQEVHPAFADIEDAAAREALSEPFLRPDTYVVFNEFFTGPADRIVPFAVGMVAVEGSRTEFLAALSQESTTPLNHVAHFLEQYRKQVGGARDSLFDTRKDGYLDLTLISSLQGKINSVARKNGLRILSGFVLGLAKERQMPVAGHVVSQEAYAAIESGIEEGFERGKDVFAQKNQKSDEKEKDKDEDEDEPTLEDLLETTKQLLIPTCVGRLLPPPRLVQGFFTQSSAELREFYDKTNKAQQKALRAERRLSSAYN